ncbi:uncharacterized protein LOC126675128 [Mercurialis annua]|uniref:uncharacterized protein LOC126675128 n=1 Tax=Mercurialis annua TaxID=3986 RepID=UPI00215F2325|nr:uncharacterized protein LOC126675128 [Mercurialis annua]
MQPILETDTKPKHLYLDYSTKAFSASLTIYKQAIVSNICRNLTQRRSIKAADMTLQCVFDGSVSIHDIEIERRPYHRNCNCALHKFNGVGLYDCSQRRNITFPKKQAKTHCLLSLAASKFSAQYSVLSDSSSDRNRRMHNWRMYIYKNLPRKDK